MLLIEWLRLCNRSARRRLTRRVPTQCVLERLEDRTLLATITVTSLADNQTVNSQVTLREAIEAANTDASVDGSEAGNGADTIVFAPGLTAGGSATITLGGTDLLLRTEITIIGPGANLLTINANQASRVFVVGDLVPANVLNVMISGLTLTNGRADFGGAIQSSEDLTLSQMKITNSSATALGSLGGGVENGDRLLTIEDSTISGNSAGIGGGVSNNGTLKVVRSTISGNTAAINGGGIGNDGVATVIATTISGNSGPNGGGIGNQGTLTVLNSTLNGNSATSFAGGGIGNANSAAALLTVIQSTISGNTAPFGGGGIGIGDAGTVNVSQSTITGNSATSMRSGGGIAFEVQNTVITNSIIAGNTAAGSPSDVNFHGTLTSASKNNLIGDPNSAGKLVHGTNGNIIGGGTGSVRTLLSTSAIISTTLANNGGPTKTHALVAGSPAINAGSNALIPIDTFDIDGDTIVAEDIPFDQRLIGFARVTGGTVDIGAFEVPPPTVTVAVAAATVLENGTANLVYTFTRTSTAGALMVNFNVAGDATFNTDYIVTGAASFTGTSGTVTFAAGSATKTVTVDPTADSNVEPNETVELTVVDGSGYVAGVANQAIGTITNDDATFTISAANATNAEGNTGTIPFTFTVTRADSTAGTGSVKFAVTGSGTNPANAADFGAAFPSGTVSFLANETSKTVTVSVKADTTFEPDESFTVTLNTPTNGVLGAVTSAVGSILNDDTGLTVSATDAIKSEGTGGSPTSFTFTVLREGNLNVTSSVKYTVAANGSGAAAAAATDFPEGKFPAGTVSFVAGEMTKLITIPVIADSGLEGNEGFKVTLSSPTGATLGATTFATGTINNDDASLSIAATSAVKAEGTGVTPTSFTFTVTRTGDTSGVSSVLFAVTGAATNGANAADFGGAFPTGIIEFAANDTTKPITIDVTGDAIGEANEGFIVTLTNPTNAILGTATANGTINNDDTSFAITPVNATSANKAEGNSTSNPPSNTAFTFTVTRIGVAVAGSVQFAVAGSGDNPADAADFANGVLPTGTVNFTAAQTSQTVTINVRADTAVELNEGFTVTLANPTNATLATSEAIGTIKNDDTSFAIAATDADKSEGNSGSTVFTFTVTRAGLTTGTASVRFAVTGTMGANPAAIADFGTAFPSGLLSFAANETSKVVTINVKGDTAPESDEGFTVTLSSPSTGTTIVVLSAQGTIRNDD